MAVDSKAGTTNGANGANGTSGTSTPHVTATGTGATPTVRPSDAGIPRRKRSSSLMQSATSLPTVEHSLEEFIAKANQTLVDASSWGEAKEQDAQRKEQDAQRWKQAETQMRESEAREASLRRQLDGLQGKLAEAEARAAVAGTQMGSAAHDTTLNELKSQIDKAMQRMRAAEERSQELAEEVTRLKAEGSARAALPAAATASAIDEDEAAERVRMAEAKAAKAIAFARAAQAGLTVSPADIAAIESGLVQSVAPAKKSSIVPIAAAFVGGIVLMFVVWKLVLSKETQPVANATPPAAVPAQVQPVAKPAEPPAAPAQPTVTPIEKAAAPSVTPIEEPKAAAETAPTPAPRADDQPAAVKAEAPKAETPAVKAAPAAKTAPKAKAKETKKAGIADPFAAPAPKAKKPADKKPPGNIVDPF